MKRATNAQSVPATKKGKQSNLIKIDCEFLINKIFPSGSSTLFVVFVRFVTGFLSFDCSSSVVIINNYFYFRKISMFGIRIETSCV